MDTSDSDDFESADEELYLEDDINKLDKNCLETDVQLIEKSVINLQITNITKESNENKLLNTLNVNDNLAQETIEGTKSNKKSNETTYVEENVDKSIQLIENEILTIPVEVQHKNIDENTDINKDNDIIEENKNFVLPEECQNKPSELKENINLVRNLDVANKETLISNVSENIDENMWDMDEWETMEDKKESTSIDTSKEYSKFSDIRNKDNNKFEPHNKDVITNKNKGNSKLTYENKENDNMWDNDTWEPILDTKINKKVILTDKNKNRENPEASTENMENDNMWDNNDWEPFEKIEPIKSCKTQPDTSWSSWGNWGVSSIFTTATQGVSTLTNQVSQGISTVLETGMGIPDPKELARQDRVVEKLVDQSESDNSTSNVSFGFGNLVSGVSHITKFVENTSSKVITGGLDTLETIGKKTMEVLQEGDPGLKNKRALLKLDKDKPILSQILREAKEKSENENKLLREVNAKKKLNYETLFDDYHGLVHLEALEMLSKQCDIKLQTLSENCVGSELKDLQETMDQIKELCELPDEDDDELATFDDIKDKIQTAVKEINVSINYDKLISTWQETENWLNNLKLEFCDEIEIHQEALKVLARLTATAVEQVHKCGELLLIKEHRSTADEADSLVQLTMAVTSLIGLVAAKFSEKLNTKSVQSGNKESVNELITNVFFEAGNSSSYLQDAFQLLVPVLQIGAV